jgi:hypothetical protein
MTEYCPQRKKHGPQTIENTFEKLLSTATELQKNTPATTAPLQNNNTQNNIKNNIKVVAFGKEDLYAISDEVCKKMLRKGFDAVPALIEYVHFNKQIPENHNVYVSNLRNDQASNYNGDRWEVTTKKEVIDKLFDDKYCFLDGVYKRLVKDNKLDEITKRKFGRFKREEELEAMLAQQAQEYGEYSDSKHNQIKKNIKGGIKLMLYNKKYIVEDTKKLLQYSAASP